MKNNLTHLGLHNQKTSIFHCGAKVYENESYNDSSIIPNRVDCIPCIVNFLHKQKYENRKTAAWHRRLGELNEAAANSIKSELTK